MSAAATAAGYLFASGILDRRRLAKAEAQAITNRYSVGCGLGVDVMRLR